MQKALMMTWPSLIDYLIPWGQLADYNVHYQERLLVMLVQVVEDPQQHDVLYYQKSWAICQLIFQELNLHCIHPEHRMFIWMDQHLQLKNHETQIIDKVPVGEFWSSLQEIILTVSMFLLRVLDQSSETSIPLDSIWTNHTMLRKLKTKLHETSTWNNFYLLQWVWNLPHFN